RAPQDLIVVVLNATPVPRYKYRVGVPQPGFYEEILNTDSAEFGGSNVGNLGGLASEPVPHLGRLHSLAKPAPYAVVRDACPQLNFRVKSRGRWLGQPSTPKGNHASQASLVTFAPQGRCGCHHLRLPLYLRSIRPAEKNHGPPGKRGHRPQGS